MISPRTAATSIYAAFILGLPVGLHATPLISEFMAVNDSTLEDEDGEFSDWIEVHNPDAVAIDLGGWHLTDRADNLDAWTFPPTLVPPGGYVVVFASNKNQTPSRPIPEPPSGGPVAAKPKSNSLSIQ